MRKADLPPSLASSSSSLPPALSSLDEEVGSAAARRESGAAPRGGADDGGADDDCTEASSSCATASSPSTSKTKSGASASCSRQLHKAEERPGSGHSLPTTVASLAGSVLEWYDFAVYGYFSDVIGQVFFPPSASRATSTVEAYVVFGAAFLARPVGAAAAGHVADASSRRRALAGSTLLMAASTLMLGALPSYERAGSAAYALLLVARLLQGLSAGGNLCTSLVFAAENHPPHLRGFYAGVLLSSTFVGLLLGSAVSALLRAVLSPGQLVAWGWRLPFLAGFAAAGSAWYLRGRGTDAHERLLREGRERAEAAAAEAPRPAPGRALALPLAGSPAPEAPRAVPAGLGERPRAGPLRATFARSNASALAGALLLSAVSAFGLYFTFVWLAAYMSELSPVPLPGAYAINTAHVVVATFVELPLAGFLSDKYGRRRAMTAGAVGVAVLAPLVMGWVSLGDPGAALASLVALGSFYSLYVSALFAWFVDSFEPAIRSTASGAVYNTAQALVGGFAPTIATLLVASSSSSSSSPAPPRSPGYLVSGLAGLALAGLWLVAPRRPRCPAEDEPGYRPPRWSDLLPQCRRHRRPAGRAVRPAEEEEEEEPQQQQR